MTSQSLVAVDTHPIQYHAPIYRALQATFGIPVSVIYGSDFSIAGYRDRDFATSFAWDVDLLSGYDSVFLSRTAHVSWQSEQPVSARGLRKELKRLRPAAVLLNGYSPAFHQIAFFETWRSGVPILFRGDTTDHGQRQGFIHKSARSCVLRSLYRRCSVMLYVGQNSYKHYKRLLVSDERLAFSPHCVDTTALLTTERHRSELRDPTRRMLDIGRLDTALLFSGKLSHTKRPDLLISGVKRLPADIRARMTILFVGSGIMQGQLETLAKQDPAVKVRFVGFQNQTQLSPYYHAADLLVLPSQSETWGLVVNEALHHGLPSVVSEAVGCAPDLIEPGVTGEICATDSVESLSTALLRAQSLTRRPTVRTYCRQKITPYTVEKAAEGIAKRFRALQETLN
jgi:glycosyltransferase involved in cell wall biosynthesis